MLKLFLVAYLASVATASVIHDGNCPDIKPVENFNVSAYQGVWYEISKYDNPHEKNGKCAQAEYKLDGDIVKLKNTHVVNGVQTSIEGTAKLADDANKAAKLLVTLNVGEASRETPLMVVATDYTNYAIAYNCKNDENKKSHQEALWVLSRTKTLEGEAKTAVDTFFKNNKELDASKLIQTDFSEEACKFTSTGVVTEHKD
ncbi:unnamed protein product [Chilo suppressalis]|uniref:Lipocalin/cytosolic fatty-acid binding domain-containing protein n=1 Tax=Chilo suppressalis TaxID=168631 RepID=A0ABN8B3G4_CHISP|nr:hypothetical protein evm_001558 [Chilo suppressalis]CAH0400610.1 unnamed protein product [Chilo suppressalis]